MSTAQDHKELASLQDVFGKGAGSSLTQYGGGVATTRTLGAGGPQGAGGSQGSVGSPISNFIFDCHLPCGGQQGRKGRYFRDERSRQSGRDSRRVDRRAGGHAESPRHSQIRRKNSQSCRRNANARISGESDARQCAGRRRIG